MAHDVDWDALLAEARAAYDRRRYADAYRGLVAARQGVGLLTTTWSGSPTQPGGSAVSPSA